MIWYIWYTYTLSYTIHNYTGIDVDRNNLLYHIKMLLRHQQDHLVTIMRRWEWNIKSRTTTWFPNDGKIQNINYIILRSMEQSKFCYNRCMIELIKWSLIFLQLLSSTCFPFTSYYIIPIHVFHAYLGSLGYYVIIVSVHRGKRLTAYINFQVTPPRAIVMTNLDVETKAFYK